LKNVAIIGGGLAGLICGIEFSKKGVPCQLFEKRSYPFHRVCGEYVSHEATPYLKSHDLFPEEYGPASLEQFQLSSIRGESATMPLDLGGFGISRVRFDEFLAKKARTSGVEICENEEVLDVSFSGKKFQVTTHRRTIEADLVIGSFGKRSKLDVQMRRDFVLQRSPYVGVKYHAKTEHPSALISLHNFSGGYCGVSNVEDGITNICYLAHRETLQSHGSIPELENKVLWQNPFLKKIFNEADFLTKKPIVINEISFATKKPVDKHILMAGDAAGMIAPLCGNGMAMAIHAGMMCGLLGAEFCSGNITRDQLEKDYTALWQSQFRNRLRFGRLVQRLFGNATLSQIAVKLAIYSRPASRAIMKNTHGKTFGSQL
jgi:flavin-dependent dehydrogenase